MASEKLCFNMKQENYVPAVYAEKPTGVSGKYTFIRTVQVIDDLVKLGWHPAVMKGNRHSTVARHLVRFRQAGVYAGPGGLPPGVFVVVNRLSKGATAFRETVSGL